MASDQDPRTVALDIEFERLWIVRLGRLDRRLLAHQFEEALEEDCGFARLLLQIGDFARIIAALVNDRERIAIVIAFLIVIARFGAPLRRSLRRASPAPFATAGLMHHQSSGGTCKLTSRMPPARPRPRPGPDPAPARDAGVLGATVVALVVTFSFALRHRGRRRRAPRAVTRVAPCARARADRHAKSRCGRDLEPRCARRVDLYVPGRSALHVASRSAPGGAAAPNRAGRGEVRAPRAVLHRVARARTRSARHLAPRCAPDAAALDRAPGAAAAALRAAASRAASPATAAPAAATSRRCARLPARVASLARGLAARRARGRRCAAYSAPRS